MLNQVIYTRCTPRMDLANGGQTIPSEGFGVFSASEDIFSSLSPRSLSALEQRLGTKNAANEFGDVGLIHSYEYFFLENGKYALSFEVARPLCEIPRKNGIGHRPGTFIKQCFVGTLQGYPWEWFGSAIWDACLKAENDYYLDDAPGQPAPRLPLVPDTVEDGYLSLPKIRDFLNAGRGNAVKAVAWFLLRQFELPVGERKILLIRDIPANVELWIAAIESGLSPELARQITFTTNCTKLGSQASHILYQSDASGEKRPVYMIAGFHPKDGYSFGIRQTPASGFVILDGAEKDVVFGAETDLSYYGELSVCSDSLVSFARNTLQAASVREISPRIPELYEACQYFSRNPDSWEYDETLKTVDALEKNHLLESIVSGMSDGFERAYSRFYDADLQNGFSLFKRLNNHGLSLIEGSLRQIIGERLTTAVCTLDEHLALLWGGLKQANIAGIIFDSLATASASSKDGDLDIREPDFDGKVLSEFLDSYLSITNGVNFSAKDVSCVIRRMSDIGVEESAQKNLFSRMDAQLVSGLMQGHDIPVREEEWKAWAESLNLRSNYVDFKDFYKKFMAESNIETAMRLIIEFHEGNEKNEGIRPSGMCLKKLLHKAAAFCDSQIQIAAILSLCPKENLSDELSAEHFVDAALENMSGEDVLKQFLSLYSTAYAQKLLVPDFPAEKVAEAQKGMARGVLKNAPQYYSSEWMQKIDKNKGIDPSTKEHLAKLFESIEEQRKPKGIKGFFSKLFGRNNRKE